MLSDADQRSARLGSLSKEIHVPATFLQELVTFIADQLPAWRDHPDRTQETSEPRLSAQLCSHLNSAARRTKGWDILQFKQEEPDATVKNRTLDLAASPCDATIWVGGRRTTVFETILPIECKRLPTPPEAGRDRREYVFSSKTTTGGIQRFKDGLHGATHNLAAMIGYIQNETSSTWHKRANEWIEELIADAKPGWSSEDHLQMRSEDTKRRMAVLVSSHPRTGGKDNIELQHLWILMN